MDTERVREGTGSLCVSGGSLISLGGVSPSMRSAMIGGFKRGHFFIGLFLKQVGGHKGRV